MVSPLVEVLVVVIKLGRGGGGAVPFFGELVFAVEFVGWGGEDVDRVVVMDGCRV